MSKADDDQKLQKAFFLHQQGKLNEAANLYRQLISRNSDNFQALHFLGVVEAGVGNVEQAKLLMARSLSIQPPNIQFIENYASILFQAGNYNTAVQVCQQGLQLNNRSVTLLYVSAISLFKLNELQDSLAQFDRLLSIQPNHIAAVNERGSVLAEMKQFDAALASFETALTLDRRYAEAHLNKGNLYGELGRNDDALASYDEALALKPDLADAWLGRGNVSRALKRYDDAFAGYDKALALKPDLAGAWLGRGNAYFELERYDEALAAFDQAVALKPDFARPWVGIGNVLNGRERYDEALASYDKAIALKPDLADAWIGRGNVFRKRQRFDEALASFDKAVALKPDLAEAWRGRGNILYYFRRCDEALAAFDRAIALKPDLAEAWLGRGDTFDALNRDDDALACFDKAIEIKADLASAYFSKSTVKLSRGEFADGWALYEWRAKASEFNFSDEAIEARGISTLNDKTKIVDKKIAVIAEQGVGDEIMFSSILPDIIRDANSITYQVDPRLIRICSRSFPGVKFVSRKQPEEILSQTFDTIIRAGSLGYVYRQDAASFPRTSYLKANPSTVDHWRSVLTGNGALFKIGLSWRGGVATSARDQRSMTLDQLGPLLTRENCTFVSLQYGDVRDELEKYNAGAGRKIMHFPKDSIDDFDDLAGLIEALDIVISVQNATVHLCGALGKTCLAMLPWKAEWRYGKSGSQMIWYSSIELFRQIENGNWSDVLSAVNSRLSVEMNQVGEYVK
jgi:tetratricopeptide (TPR) repeat protein